MKVSAAKIGDVLVSPELGKGTVVETDGAAVRADFDKGGLRWINDHNAQHYNVTVRLRLTA